MKIFSFLLICLIGLGSTSAQIFKTGISPVPNERSLSSQQDTLKILAVMVNFDKDRDGATFGDGKFGSIYTQNYGNDILDPLPHDKNYFESHLQFVKNYFESVSGGRVIIEFEILPDTFSVSQTMRNYAPDPGDESDLTPLGNFAQEVWTIADQMNPGFRFNEFDVFTIFHAGVGRDISLPGSIGNERDLPSVYLGDRSLKNIFGSSFDGFPVSGGNFKITNSMIIPETESRELNAISGTVLFEISINGLLVASVASHLGLPDLFDTETGLSAIGRFGLMDGQSIFAYNGTFPPEPSAWEKIYLGWAEPVEINPGNYDINLVTRLAATLADTVILKVPINSTEYYLIENRNRDALNNGANVTYVVGVDTIQKTFTKDTTGFQSFDVDSLSGVVISVDEYDWSLPGSGILIWHIDEQVINEKLAENKINTDKNNRGVDVEEADGIQDIGETFITIFGDEVVGEGFQDDMWFSSNESEFFENRFSKNTRPSTRTNSGANSLITISGFSDVANKMSFMVSYGDSLVRTVSSSELNLNSQPDYLTTLVSNSDLLYAVVADSDLVVHNGQVELFSTVNFSAYEPAAVLDEQTDYVVGAIGSFLNIVERNNSQFNFSFTSFGSEISAAPVIKRNAPGQLELYIATANGNVLIYDLQIPGITDSIQFSSGLMIRQVALDENYVSVIGEQNGNSKLVTSTGNEFTFENTAIQVAVTKNKNGEYINVVLTEQNKFYILSGSEILSEFEVASSGKINSFSLGDLKQDGENYIVFSNGGMLEARNLTGASADNFPYVNPVNSAFTSTPLLADFEADNNSEIIAYDDAGNIYAVNGSNANLISGFPISIGSMLPSVPSIYNVGNEFRFSAISQSGLLNVWQFGLTSGDIFWAEKLGNSLNNAFTDAAESSNFISDFMPEERAYNYPNPVYDGETFIRYYVAEDAEISIKIFDLAGDLVKEMNDSAQGGVDNETAWNVNNIQSGVYFAHIEANSVSGKSQSKIIKIAVVK